MVFCLISCVFCNSFLWKWIILPAAIAFGIKFAIKKSRGKVDPKNEIDISGKTVIITGASDGIGKITAEELAVRGAKVILACRNLTKAEAVVEDIRKTTRNGELILMQLDLSSLSSIRTFATEFISKYGGSSSSGLSILINNAGLGNNPGERKMTKDGFEESFGVNHLGHFLLTQLLLPELERAAELNPNRASRIVNVSSGTHCLGKLNFDDLMYEKTPLQDFKYMNVSQLYCNSKLANNLFNLELAKRLRAKKVNVNSYALCPGLVKTNIQTARNLEKPLPFHLRYFLYPFLSFFIMKNSREGAETTLYCALSKYLEHHSGEMYRNSQFWDYSKRVKLSQTDAELLWEKSEQLVNLK